MQKLKNYFERIPIHLVVAASAWGSRFLSAFIQIISIRTLLSYLGEERYAVYVITYSLSAWIALADCGVGASLQNYISECRAHNKSYDKYLKAALQLISVFFIIFIATLIALSPFIQSELFIKYMHLQEIHSVNIIGIIGSILIITILTGIVYRVYYALQKGYISSILPALSMVISMILIVLLNKYSPVRGSILYALLIFTVPQLIIVFIPFLKIFGKFFSRIFIFDRTVLKELATRSGKFFGLGIMAAVTLNIDYIIMSQTVSAANITMYNIFSKIFALLLFIHSALLLAAWPVFSELFNKGQFAVIKKMIRKYVIFGTAIIALGTFLIYFFAGYIVKILSPALPIAYSASIFAFFGIYFILRVWSETFTVFLQSINSLRIFWIIVPFQALISFSCQLYFSSKYGIYGIIAGLAISFLLTGCWAFPYKTWKIFKSKENSVAI